MRSSGSSIGLGWRQRDESGRLLSDYEEIWPPGQFREIDVPSEIRCRPTTAAERDVFPADGAARARVKKIPADVPVVLVVPPTFHTIVPQPGSDAAPRARGLQRRVEAASWPAGRAAISSTTASTTR